MTQTALRSRQAAGWTLVAVATYCAVFVLPYRFPLRQPVLSDTWIAGANNQAAAIALALLSAIITVVLFCCRSRRESASVFASTSEIAPRISLYPLLLAIAISTLWTALLGHAVHTAGLYWGDEGYFLNQLQTRLHVPYQPIEFAYGPALLLWPELFLKTLPLATPAAYLLSLLVLQAIGLVLLRYVVNALPMRRGLKLCAFALFAFGTLNSLLGLNYTVFRFILPFAAIILLTRQIIVLRAIVIAASAEILLLAVSPELGAAFAAACIVLSLYRGITRRRPWLLVALAAIIGAWLFASAIGLPELTTLRAMTNGGFNLLLTPAPHILVLLIAAVVLAPLAVARHLRTRHDLTLGLYVAALAMLPAALGRCDPIHILFDGLGLFLLAFVALDAAPPRLTQVSLAVAAALFALTQLTNLPLYGERIALILHPASVRNGNTIDVSQLLAGLHGAPVSAPMLAPPPVLASLTRAHQYLPGFYCGWVGVWDAEAEQRKIADMRRTPYALISLADPVAPSPENDRRILRWMHVGLTHHALNPPYLRGALLTEELKQHWQPAGHYGDYVLFHQR